MNDCIPEGAIAEIIDSVWGQVLGLAAEPRESCLATDAPPDLSVCVHIAGAWNGAVLLWPSDQFATQATARLFAIAEVDVTAADVQDGMAELGNIIAGNLKALLPGPSHLALPTVTRGHQHEVFVRRTRLVAHHAFASQGEPLSLLVLEGIRPPADAAATV